ncbi:histidine phosphotransferase family protein [Pseudorhodobacter sp. MZDSW-24AT]|uniref:histidine phosphotransferase family protein n=1 Tax=Pseudorhodobacter sp. MZDSW-24AT TaxID=2052957 RepID=UPI000C1EFCD7|nr:histidine phosphotransferase family protein [Pseudorhodobacter sp. MZDSW-24AT]PJF07800.1 histidine phosphotransferase [Pseudorhodobacter sp. MZDSW-24AT]
MSDKPDLTALLGSRICHDLISPIGAIGNGVELLMMDGITPSQELSLIVDSVAHANARIRFFRVAFGAAGSGDQRISRAEVAGILADQTRGGRLSVEWNTPTDLSRREVKLAFLGLLCLESALPQGGSLWIDRGDQRWTLRATAPRLRIEPALWELLSHPAASVEIGPGQVHFPLLRDEIARQHRRLTVEVAETALRLSF